MAPRAVAARGSALCSGAGSAAAGIAEFLRGRAFFPVAGSARAVLMGLATGTGVFGRFFGRVDGVFLSVTGSAGWF